MMDNLIFSLKTNLEYYPMVIVMSILILLTLPVIWKSDKKTRRFKITNTAIAAILFGAILFLDTMKIPKEDYSKITKLQCDSDNFTTTTKLEEALKDGALTLSEAVSVRYEYEDCEDELHPENAGNNKGIFKALGLRALWHKLYDEDRAEKQIQSKT